MEDEMFVMWQATTEGCNIGRWDGNPRPERSGWKSSSFFLPTIIMTMVLLVMMSGVKDTSAQAIITVKGQTKAVEQEPPLELPYVFFNTSFGAAAGFVYGGSGFLQRQSTTVATAIAGSNNSLALFVLSRDIQVPFARRFFIDTDIALSTYGDIVSYAPGNPEYPYERAGSNNSHVDNYIHGTGSDNFGRVKVRYLLPIGHGRDQIIPTLVFENGLLVEGAAGGTSWNPFVSGRTFLEAKPYWRQQVVRSEFGKHEKKTNGVEFSLLWDNTDLTRNPSRGNSLRLRFNKDWGFFDSTNPYVVLDGEFCQYISLGESETFKQRVLAFDIWTSNSPSWDDYTVRRGQLVGERAPAFSGSTLGGLFRMRGYPTSRFNDQAAIYYAAEYRVIPRWNPWADIGWVHKYLGIAWWQIVPFVEAGRVAPEWSLSTLHSSMKWDGGVGVRALARGILIRIDIAGSNEGFGVNMMIGHPFNF